MKISREFRLLLSCCRRTFADAAYAALDDLCAGADWHLFLRLTRFHGVQGLAWQGIYRARTDIPEEAARALAADSAAIAASNLQNAVECRRILSAFENADQQLLFVKGLTVGALAYRNASIKAAVDVDLLISKDQLEATGDLMQALGYRLAIPGSREKLSAWHAVHKESVWLAVSNGLRIDLHTALADNPALIPSIGIASPNQWVNIANGIELPTLAGEELIAYLAVHGASSAWFRLKWITDFAALLHGSTAAEIDRLYRRSLELGASRAIAQALLLADELYGTLSELPALQHELGRDQASRWLFRAALWQMAGRTEPVEPTSVRFGTGVIHLSQLLLRPGVAFKASEALRQVRSALG